MVGVLLFCVAFVGVGGVVYWFLLIFWWRVLCISVSGVLVGLWGFVFELD